MRFAVKTGLDNWMVRAEQDSKPSGVATQGLSNALQTVALSLLGGLSLKDANRQSHNRMLACGEVSGSPVDCFSCDAQIVKSSLVSFRLDPHRPLVSERTPMLQDR
jgi:hypothetical protein